MSPTSHLRAGCAALLALAAAACSSGGSSKATPPSTAPTKANVRVTPGLTGVASAGAPVQLAATDRDAILTAVRAYVQDATVAPLEGEKVPDLASHFAPAAAPALNGPEHDALLDTDGPRARGRVTVSLLPVNVKGLADPSGAVDLIGATIDLTVRAGAAAGPITIHRSGELMFTRDAGAWKILSFKLTVTRDGAGLGAATSSTTKAAS
jgi:hypothetical protein